MNGVINWKKRTMSFEKKSFQVVVPLDPAEGVCYETNSRKDRKDRSTPENSASSRGKPPLHYINEQFLHDSNDKTSFLYIGV